MGCLFRRYDVARLPLDPSVAACLDPSQHSLKNGGRNIVGFDVTLLVVAVGETVF